MAKASLLVLKVAMILISLGWVSLWLLKPTQLWTRKWHAAEESASTTVFSYNGTTLTSLEVYLKRSLEAKKFLSLHYIIFFPKYVFINYYRVQLKLSLLKSIMAI